MEGLELICFQIISSVGTARSCFVEAIQAAKAGNFNKADELIQEGKNMLREGHSHHTTLVQNEAEGQKTDINLLLIHSEDQMMSAEVLEIMSQEIIELYRNK
jgi:PTS system cellobiose-specific IIA component